MSNLTRKQADALEPTLQRALHDPMPRDLDQVVQNLIEPHTVNMSIDHGDVMQCIHVAWPVIRDYLTQGPGSLPAIVDWYDEDEDE